MKQYDFIFAGGGLSALMTLLRMHRSGEFSGKNILLIEPDSKTSNDRTWCFWSIPGFEWDFLASRSWEKIAFKNSKTAREMPISPYRYNMVRGIDLYDHIIPILNSAGNIEFVSDRVVSFAEDGLVTVQGEKSRYFCRRLISSIYDPKNAATSSRYPFIQQHFIGWHVRTDKEVFEPSVATFMDFSVEQSGNTRFMYVLPFSKNEALVEYTLFSAELLFEKEYEDEIAGYLSRLGVEHFTIASKEKGAIPMTTFPFWRQNSKNIIHIGTAGGWTKASTGYTFKNASEKSKRLLEFLKSEQSFTDFHRQTRHDFYDSLLLDILSKSNEKGSEIFSSMFMKGNPAPVLRFLDSETSLAEDITVIARCPKRLFFKALIKKLVSGKIFSKS